MADFFFLAARYEVINVVIYLLRVKKKTLSKQNQPDFIKKKKLQKRTPRNVFVQTISREGNNNRRYGN